MSKELESDLRQSIHDIEIIIVDARKAVARADEVLAREEHR